MNKSAIYGSSPFLVLFLLLLLTGSSNYAQSPGFFLDEWQERTAEIPAGIETATPDGDPTVTISVDRDQVINKVPHYIYGNNAVTWDNAMSSNATAMNDLRNLSPNVLRWPGGNLSNEYFWNRSVGDRPADIPSDINPWYGQDTENWQRSVNEYYGLLEQTNSTGIICVNYSYARYGTGPNPVATAAHMAAEWVRYDNGRTKFWELGNENYGDWQTGYEIDVNQNQDGQPQLISGQLYGQHCKVFIDSMRAAAAEIGVEIKIGPNVYDAETSHNQVFEDWNEGLMPEIGDLVDFMAVHSYFTPYNEDSPVITILNSHDVPEEIMSALEADMAEAGKPMLPVAMTEWNIFAVGSWQQVSYINGMLAAITLGEYVKHNYGMANRWDLVNGWNNGNDHGMFSKGGEPGVDPYNPRAVFFYMYYHQKYFGDRMVETSVTGSSQVVAHASTFSSGETGIVIVNKSVKGEIVQIDLPDAPYGLNYYYHTLTGGTDNGSFSRKVLINGIETDEEGGGPDEYENIRANVTETRKGIKVDLPRLSVVYVMVEKAPPFSYVHAVIDTSTMVIDVQLSEEIQPISDHAGLEVKVNGSPVPILSVNLNSGEPNFFHIFLDQDLTPDDQITITYSGSGIRSLDGATLIPFTNESVENLIPEGPFTVTLITREAGTESLLENCLINFNDETKTTDGLGQAVFVAMEGEYSCVASRENFDTTRINKIRLISDTTIHVEMERTIYMVSFHLSDEQTGEDLRDVEIVISGETENTSPAGFASFQLPAESYLTRFSKLNYHSQESVFQVGSDTTIEVALQPSHARVIFRLKYGAQPINNALIILDGDSLYTGYFGTCQFESVPVDTNLEYRIEKEYYYDLQGELLVKTDTTIDLQLIESAAKVEFLVSAVSEPVENGYVILGQDTSLLKESGQASFYNLPLDMEYTYVVESDNYESFSGSLTLEKDTTVQALLTTLVSTGNYTYEELRIYPNPARKVIYVDSYNAPILSLELVDASGKIVVKELYRVPKYQVELPLNADPGLYFLRTTTEKETLSRRVIIH